MTDAGVLRTLLAPRKTLFGVGAVEKIAEEAKQLGGKKVLIVTDETVMKLKIVDKVRDPLTSDGFEVDIWDKVEPEPTMIFPESANSIIALGPKVTVCPESTVTGSAIQQDV